MKIDVCTHSCKFIGPSGYCELYDTPLRTVTLPDPFDKGKIVRFAKCTDCREKELSCSIDIKVRDLYSFHQSYIHEMAMLFEELEQLIDVRKSIYTGEEE